MPISKGQFELDAFVHHKGFYKYNLVPELVYISWKVKIICPKHGMFEQRASDHIRGHGCKICVDEAKTKPVDVFIAEAKAIHGNKYIYDNVDYTQANIPIEIICRKCNKSFMQTPSHHLHGHGCSNCAGNAKKDNEHFEKDSREIFGDIFDYSLLNYIDCRTKVILICKFCDCKFEMTPNTHLSQKHGCSNCKITGFSKISIEWLEYMRITNPRIQHKLNGGEFNIPDSNYKADGFLPPLEGDENQKGTIFEFQGCRWHSCPVCYPNRDEIHSTKQITHNELYQRTIEKREYCEKMGYKYIEMWECEWMETRKKLVLPNVELLISDYKIRLKAFLNAHKPIAKPVIQSVVPQPTTIFNIPEFDPIKALLAEKREQENKAQKVLLDFFTEQLDKILQNLH